jgi:hypothetical protein
MPTISHVSSPVWLKVLVRGILYVTFILEVIPEPCPVKRVGWKSEIIAFPTMPLLFPSRAC